MWNRGKREDEPSLRQAPIVPDPVREREVTPAPAYSTPRRYEEPSTRAAAVIGKSLQINGRVTGKEDLVVDGRVEGDVDLPENRLTVGAGGHVQGGIKAREIVVYGSVHGNLEAVERVEIKRNARVVGDLRTARPVIEDEAYFKGSVETVRADTPKASVKAAAAPAAVSTPADSAGPVINTTAEIKRG